MLRGAGAANTKSDNQGEDTVLQELSSQLKDSQDNIDNDLFPEVHEMLGSLRNLLPPPGTSTNKRKEQVELSKRTIVTTENIKHLLDFENVKLVVSNSSSDKLDHEGITHDQSRKTWLSCGI